MSPYTTALGKTLYALLFLVAIPVGLWYWTSLTEPFIQLPGIVSETGGLALIIVGLALMLKAMWMLMTVGEGLPMNAFPPSNLVTTGPYQFFRHPIYVGFGALLLGISLYMGSAAGLWLITPLVILGMLALVMGYEAPFLQEQFPDQAVTTVFDIPGTSRTASLRVKLAATVVVFSLGLLYNFVTSQLLSSQISHSSLYPDNDWFSTIHHHGLIAIIIVPFLLKENVSIRRWITSLALATSILLFIVLFYPEVAITFTGLSASFVFPIVLLMISLYEITRLRNFKILLAFPLVILLAAEVLWILSAPMALFWQLLICLVAVSYRWEWKALKETSEWIANSWQEWTFGRIRVINHGFYIGIGTFLGILMAGVLAGRMYAYAILIFAVVVTICSALWAQLVEGSDKLKRPFGYYGGLFGIALASMVVWGLGYNTWVIIAVISVAMPWVQAVGRLRCLVNGCCHGKVTRDHSIGIRYHHPRSRVSHLSGMKGQWLHPTPLYSILWLTIVGFVMLSLWLNAYSYAFIFGIYLILTSLGRFVEEAYRGEVQTKIIQGLRLYQWTAIFSLLVGIVMTLIQVPQQTIDPGLTMETIIAAVIGGGFLTFAMGIDFPYSNARFSRLV